MLAGCRRCCTPKKIAARPISTRLTVTCVLFARTRPAAIAPPARAQPPAPNDISRNTKTQPMGCRLGDSAREVKHRHEHKHHYAEQQSGPLHLDPRGRAQRRGHQCDAHEVHPERPPGHVGRHEPGDAGVAQICSAPNTASGMAKNTGLSATSLSRPRASATARRDTDRRSRESRRMRSTSQPPCAESPQFKSGPRESGFDKRR